jgi:hypothetical protein
MCRILRTVPRRGDVMAATVECQAAALAASRQADLVLLRRARRSWSRAHAGGRRGAVLGSGRALRVTWAHHLGASPGRALRLFRLDELPRCLSRRRGSGPDFHEMSHAI